MEIFKDIPKHTGYQVSNMGRVKSKKRKIGFNHQLTGKRHYRISSEKILSPCKQKSGYLSVTINGKTYRVHQLVAMAFLNHKPNGHNFVIDHINSIKDDNRLENLRIISNRDNCTRKSRGKSKYVGVQWCNTTKKWKSQVRFKGRRYSVGSFKTEKEARNAYLKKIEELNNG